LVAAEVVVLVLLAEQVQQLSAVMAAMVLQQLLVELLLPTQVVVEAESTVQLVQVQAELVVVEPVLLA
jgi:hypothetical protein